MVNYADARVMRWCHVRQLVHHPAGVEGTGSYGAELTRALTAGAVEVIDVDRPDRASRRAKGKSDPLDAYPAARGVASGRASAVPKSRDGMAESIRCLRVARRSAVKAKTQCINQIRGLLVNGPAELGEQMKPLTMTKLVNTLARLRPAGDVACPATACRRALRSLARRHVSLTAEIRQLDRDLVELTTAAPPGLMAKFGVRVDVTAHLTGVGGLKSAPDLSVGAGAPPLPCDASQRDPWECSFKSSSSTTIR